MLEVIIAMAASILLGNALARKLRVTPAIVLMLLGLILALIPVHQLNEGLGPHRCGCSGHA